VLVPNHVDASNILSLGSLDISRLASSRLEKLYSRNKIGTLVANSDGP